MTDTTKPPTFRGREHRHTGPALLDYDRGEFWMHGISHDGVRVTAPCIRQRDGESLEETIARVVNAEAASPGWVFPEEPDDV